MVAKGDWFFFWILWLILARDYGYPELKKDYYVDSWMVRVFLTAFLLTLVSVWHVAEVLYSNVSCGCLRMGLEECYVTMASLCDLTNQHLHSFCTSFAIEVCQAPFTHPRKQRSLALVKANIWFRQNPLLIPIYLSLPLPAICVHVSESSLSPSRLASPQTSRTLTRYVVLWRSVGVKLATKPGLYC